MNKKNIKKRVKPAFVVDLTDCVDGFDVLYKFAITKHEAGLPITDDELDAIVQKKSMATTLVFDVDVFEMKKTPWYKRFWRWLTRKK